MGEVILTHLGGFNVITEVLTSIRRKQKGQSPRRRCDFGNREQRGGIMERGHEPRQTGGTLK